ncbi:MAG: hypothetical protein IKW87_07365 [Ruminococcus sp.]|nr:hypothetical protein [Ruminococcus sp.]
MDIAEYNLLTEDNASILKYASNPAHRLNRVYYTDKDEVIIVGIADNNFIFWLSVTGREDRETNKKIFDHINSIEPTIFGSFSKVIDKTKYSYEKTKGFYYADFTHGGWIPEHYREIKELCKAREAGGKYLQFMRNYLNFLQSAGPDNVKNYESKKAVIELIKRERYLLLSDSSAVRKLYRELEKCGSNLYNRYMDEIH